MENTNYTQEMTDALVQAYVACPNRVVVDQYAELFNKSSRSIIAKLVREGVYQAQDRVTKTGEPVVRKQDLVEKIEAVTGIDLPSLAKASKSDLVELSTFIETYVEPVPAAQDVEAALKTALAWQADDSQDRSASKGSTGNPDSPYRL